MKVKVGDMLSNEFDDRPGKIVAITKDWIICEHGSRGEVAIHRENDQYWITVDEFEIGGGQDHEAEV